MLRHELIPKKKYGASCYHAQKCPGSLKGGLETNIEMCRHDTTNVDVLRSFNLHLSICAKAVLLQYYGIVVFRNSNIVIFCVRPSFNKHLTYTSCQNYTDTLNKLKTR